MITTWLAITLAIIGVGHATCKKGAVLDSVSEIAYIIPHWAFSSWTALVGILLMPDIMEHLPENWQWIGFFCIVGLCCVAASSYYKTEAKALRRTGHITGRTAFDRKVTSEINPDAVYHAMNETLRSEFYTGTWSPENMERHSIFLSQGDYPLKGFHYMLKAMPQILEKFPDAHLYVAGNSIIGPVGGAISEKGRVPLPLRISSYGKYLLRLIRRLGLQDHVTMLGRLSAQEMKEQYLRSNVFVCASIMENSPNSMCEAMLLGVPVVAAKVGGVPDLLTDAEEGILFPGGKWNELAEGVKTVFYDDDLACFLGENAQRRAQFTHNPDTNYRRLLEIYKSMI